MHQHLMFQAPVQPDDEDDEDKGSGVCQTLVTKSPRMSRCLYIHTADDQNLNGLTTSQLTLHGNLS